MSNVDNHEVPDLDGSDDAGIETTVSFRYDLFADAPRASVFEDPIAWVNSMIGSTYYDDSYSRE